MSIYGFSQLDPDCSIYKTTISAGVCLGFIANPEVGQGRTYVSSSPLTDEFKLMFHTKEFFGSFQTATPPASMRNCAMRRKLIDQEW